MTHFLCTVPLLVYINFNFFELHDDHINMQLQVENILFSSVFYFNKILLKNFVKKLVVLSKV